MINVTDLMTFVTDFKKLKRNLYKMLDKLFKCGIMLYRGK